MYRYKRLIGLVLVAFCFVNFTSCDSDKSSQLVKYDLSADPVNLDPPLADDPSSALAVTNLFEGLLRLAADGKVTEGVAEDYTVSDDGLTYVFQLRENALWSDGSPVTAKDFVFGFQRLFDPETGSETAKQFYCIKNAEAVHSGNADVSAIGVTADGDYTLTIQLDYVNPMFLTLLTTPAAMPCNQDFFTESKGRYGLTEETIMGNGAYILKSWSKGEYLALRKNPQYHSATPVLNGGVSLYIQPDEEERKNDFNSENSYAISVSGDQAEQFSGKGNNIDENTNSVWGLVFNRNTTAFSGTTLAQALTYDMDRSKYETCLPDYLTLADAIVPPAVTLLEKPYRTLAQQVHAPAYDPNTALSLVQQTYNQLEISSLTDVTVILPEGSPHAEVFSYISQTWQKDLKVYFKVEQLPREEYETRLAAGDYDCALVELTGTYNSPEAYMSEFPGVGGLLLQAQRVSLESSVEYYAQAEQQVLNAGDFLPLYFQANCFITNNSVTGFIRDISGQIIDFKNCEFQ